MYPQVFEQWKVASQLASRRDDEIETASEEQIFRSAGWKGALRKFIEYKLARRKTQSSSAYESAYQIAESYAELGDTDQTIQWLNAAYQEHDVGLLGLKTDFRLDSLHSDPRFAELERKVGLPQ